MEKFLVEPLRSVDISTVIVVDALDECKDEDPESAILPVLGKSILDIPRVKVFITGRPDPHIITGFRGPLRDLTDIFVLHKVEPRTINQDIRHFFEHELSKLARRRSSEEGWPTSEQLDSLCRRAAGFFVYAVATVNFLNHHLEDPWDQLDIIMESPESTAWEGEATLKVYNSLDTLYASVLHASFHKNKAKDDDVVRSVLSCVVLAVDPLSSSAIATLLGLSHHKVQRVLELTRSLLVLPLVPNEPVRPFHKSFPDFMTDQTRCADPRFYISTDYHTELFMRCLKIIGKPLRNTPPLPDCDFIRCREDLPEIEKENVCGALKYACQSWHKHLVVVENPTLDVLSALLDLLEEDFVFWLVVLKTLFNLRSFRQAMNTTTPWLKKV